MNSISLDFKNKMTCIMTAGQQGTEYAPDLHKELFYPYIPEKYRNYNSFTWNFEDETFAVNRDFTFIPGALMTENSFVPEVIIPMKGLSLYFSKFIELMGFEEYSTKDIFDGLLEEIFFSTVFDDIDNDKLESEGDE